MKSETKGTEKIQTNFPDGESDISLHCQRYGYRRRVHDWSPEARNLQGRRCRKISYFPVKFLEQFVAWWLSTEYLIVDNAETLRREFVFPQFD